MKLPWVSREAYEAVQDALANERENARILRRELFAKPPLVPPAVPVVHTPFVPPEPNPPSPVSQVIREQSQNGDRIDHRLRKHLRGLADRLKREGKTEDEIVGALCDWQTSEAVEVE